MYWDLTRPLVTLKLLIQDPEVRAVILTGAGDKSFCAGADLKAISRGENLFHPEHSEWGFAGYVRHFIDKPTIAAVNGTALGGGTELALASDLVVAFGHLPAGLPTDGTRTSLALVVDVVTDVGGSTSAEAGRRADERAKTLRTWDERRRVDQAKKGTL